LEILIFPLRFKGVRELSAAIFFSAAVGCTGFNVEAPNKIAALIMLAACCISFGKIMSPAT
jgi:hypothetical protein